MSEIPYNSGVQISGGTVSGQIVSQSSGTFTQHNTVAGSPDADLVKALTDRLDELERLLAEHSADVPQSAAAVRDVTDLKDEVARGGDRDKDRIADTLTRLTKRVGTVTVLAAAAEKLREAIAPFF